MPTSLRLVTFRTNDSSSAKDKIGTLAGENYDIVIDLNEAYDEYLGKGRSNENHSSIASSMVELLDKGAVGLAACEKALDYAGDFLTDKEFQSSREKERMAYKANEVKLLPPLPFPRLIMDFLSFEQHIRNTRSKRGQSIPKEWYEFPVCYKKSPGSIVGNGENIVWPSYTNRLDYELELAIYVGKIGKNITEDKAFNHIAGYSVFNDFSARDIQFREMNVGLGPFKGKDFDTAGALGPCIVTADEVQDPHNLEMTARINGEIWSRGNTKDMHWKIPKLISYASLEETIYPGYILGTGTVGNGCGIELDKFLKPGDAVELEIEKLGVLKNGIVK